MLTTILGSARGQCQYEVTAIIQAPECPFTGYPGITPTGINNAGHVCGYYNQCEDGEDAFLWLGPGQFITLPRPSGFTTARALAINDDDVVVGTMATSPSLDHAFIYQDGQMIDLGIPTNGNYAKAQSINDENVVCGYWGNNATGDPGARAFRWQAGSMTDLAALSGPNSVANHISENGKITGWMGNAPQTNAHAFIWENGDVVDVGVIPGGYTSEGRVITADGMLAGIGFLPHTGSPSFVRHAFAGSAKGLVDIGTLPDFLESFCTGGNDAQTLLGYCHNPVTGGDRAFIFQSGLMQNLNDRLKGSTVILTHPGGINDQGKIICDTVDAAVGPNVVLLSPIGPKLGDVDLDCRVDSSDLLLVINHWGELNSIGDANEDGTVNVADLLLVLNNWSL